MPAPSHLSISEVHNVEGGLWCNIILLIMLCVLQKVYTDIYDHIAQYMGMGAALYHPTYRLTKSTTWKGDSDAIAVS